MQWAGMLLVALALQTGEAKGPAWVKDLDTGRAAAEESGKPLFLVFT